MSNETMGTGYPKTELITLLRDLLRSCRRTLALGLILVVLLGAAMGILTHVRYTPVYQASASFAIRVTNPLYKDQYYYNSSTAEQMAKTFPYILTSGVLSSRVKERLGIPTMPAVSASAMGNTNVFTLTVTSPDPELAYEVLCCVMEEYPELAEFVVGPTDMTLVNQSGEPTQPVNAPNYKKSVLAGMVVGIALWVAILFAYYITHRTVANEEELSKVVNVTCLGRLPKVRGVSRRMGNCPILTERTDKFGFNESVRLLRVRVEKELARCDGKVLMVTSSIPNEGKTTVAVNLAVALAQKGKKTLLVDYDLRNPSISAVLNLKVKYGFSDFLRGDCMLHDVLFRTEQENLYTVFGGKGVQDPEKLLNSANVAVFMKAARETFDYVILDTPPCAMIGDAAQIGDQADGILLAVRQEFTCRRQILEGVQLLGDTQKPILGTVLNMTPVRIRRGSYSNYGYGYYGGYGGYGSYGSYGRQDGEDEA